MEGLILLAILLSAGYLLVLPILTLIAWSRSGEHSNQIDKLRKALKDAEARASSLETRLGALQASVKTLNERRETEAPQPFSAPAGPASSAATVVAQQAPAAQPEAAQSTPAQPLQRPAEPTFTTLRTSIAHVDSPLPEAMQASLPVDDTPLQIQDNVPALDAAPVPWGEAILPEALAPVATSGQPAWTPVSSTTEPDFAQILPLDAPASPTPLPAEPHPETVSSTPAAQTRPDAVVQPPIPQRPAARPSPARRPPQPRVPAEPSLIERGFNAAKDWLFGGNTIVRVGMLLVFLGLAFLLRYASERVVIPLELRYLGVAATSLVALALGWKLRFKRQAYALLMQGGAVAVMYLTVFAALKLHDQPLLSTEVGFALLVAVVALSGLLAVMQDSLSLAVAGALGGFATPVLVSTGGGNHVALFTYFALLNCGILGIAWFKAWRPLNLIGFFGTFLIGLAWGLRSYDPALHFGNTEPFLILFFLMFVTIGLLFARRVLLDDPDTPSGRDTAEWTAWLAQKGHAAQRYVDGTILFGTPIVAFGLQVGLIRHIEYGTAFSALALGGFYLLLARLAHGANPLRHRLLTEIFLALGMIFASLAIPLGLDAQWTSAAWAVEAAGIYWIGHRQQRPFARAFALLLQAGAIIAFLQKLDVGQDTLLSGSALGALMLGLSLLSNMLVLNAARAKGDTESWDSGLGLLFATAGLWSLYLIAPLMRLAEGCAIIWGIAGFATVFVATRFRPPAWLANGVGILLLSLLAFGGTLGVNHSWELPEPTTLLYGKPLVALLLGVVMLACALLVRFERQDSKAGTSSLQPLFSTLGLWLLYLIAPLTWLADTTAAVWAIAGMLTVFIGLRLKARGWLTNALLLQLATGLLFLNNMDRAAEGSVLMLASSGWKGLVIASLIGLASLVSLGAAIREARKANDPAQVARLAWAMLFGLGFIALAVLFVLPWQTATAVWAACGFVLMWAAMRLKLKQAFWFALALEVIAGAAFLKANSAVFFLFGHLPPPEGTTPFAHAGFWTPIVIALAAFAVAWRLHAWARSPAATDADALQIDGDWISFPALLWSACWWAFGWWMELRWQAGNDQVLAHQFLAVMAASVLLLLPIAGKWRWARLAGLCGLLLPLAGAVAAFDYSADANLLGESGWVAFGLALIAGFGLLRVSKNLLASSSDKLLHLVNTWVWLGVAALELRYLFLSLGEPGSTWRWLGWTLPLAAWLLWNARKAPPRLWPAAAHPQIYRFSSTLPVLVILLAWLLMVNLQSTGNAAPLPFIPLINPLEIALLLVLFAGWQWVGQLRTQDPALVAWQPLHAPLQVALLAGGFLTYTCVVLRAAHHFAGVAWNNDALLHSMTVQASLSVAWALLALGLMISGHRRARRAVWVSGAVLVAVVVAKLFFVELSNHGGLERIISFIGVGVLLLVVGYFAPLPPSKEENQ
ncbi:DUF2339 domain-containing protein [Uliginosibacterium sp. 31-16]|uniref:DUF2339 domain-containing protein n=1 Tax=Uliginosibacterium sp. 31-16 TaxID=3068315 RepID=UPI00273E6AE8|nr:DUF2339 domain-containing protein [Uliginosibacterium sp. 31-16]MDP5240577.1 DUF2339 domain-containing protein [Uliginosibacterium sp. 31-16]